MKCKTKLEPNSLWSYWFILLVTALQCYLFYRAFERIDYANQHGWDVSFLLAVLLSFALISFVAFCLLTALKNGNFASDSQKLGKLVAKLVTDDQSPRPPTVVARVWRHFPPVGSVLHCLSAFLLLISLLLLDSKKIATGVGDRDRLLRSDLDIIFVGSADDRLSNIFQIGPQHQQTNISGFVWDPVMPSDSTASRRKRSVSDAKRVECFTKRQRRNVKRWCRYSVIKSSDTNKTTESPKVIISRKRKKRNFEMAAKHRRSKREANKIGTTNLENAEYPKRYPSPEYLNYVLALLICFMRYPSVFWFTSKPLAAIFAAHQLCAVVEFCFAYGGFTVLYKYLVTFGSDEKSGFALNAHSALAVYLVNSAVVFLAPIVIFTYGHSKYYAFYKRCQLKYQGVGSNLPDNTCRAYFPNIVAMVVLILISVTKAPLIYDYLSLYRITRAGPSVQILSTIIVAAVYVFVWITVWFVLTLKQTFDFHIQLPYRPKPRPYNPFHTPQAQSEASSQQHFSYYDAESLNQFTEGGAGGGCDNPLQIATVCHSVTGDDISPRDSASNQGDVTQLTQVMDTSGERFEMLQVGVAQRIPSTMQLSPTTNNQDSQSSPRQPLQPELLANRPHVTFAEEVDAYSHPGSPETDRQSETGGEELRHGSTEMSQEVESSGSETDSIVDDLQHLSEQDRKNYMLMMRAAGIEFKFKPKRRSKKLEKQRMVEAEEKATANLMQNSEPRSPNPSQRNQIDATQEVHVPNASNLRLGYQNGQSTPEGSRTNSLQRRPAASAVLYRQPNTPTSGPARSLGYQNTLTKSLDENSSECSTPTRNQRKMAPPPPPVLAKSWNTTENNNSTFAKPSSNATPSSPWQGDPVNRPWHAADSSMNDSLMRRQRASLARALDGGGDGTCVEDSGNSSLPSSVESSEVGDEMRRTLNSTPKINTVAYVSNGITKLASDV